MYYKSLMTETVRIKTIKQVQVVHKILYIYLYIYIYQHKVFEYITDVEKGIFWSNHTVSKLPFPVYL